MNTRKKWIQNYNFVRIGMLRKAEEDLKTERTTPQKTKGSMKKAESLQITFAKTNKKRIYRAADAKFKR